MHEFGQRLLRSIRRQKLIQPGQRVAIAVSGGADSVALLRLLAELKPELGIVLFAAHFNHQLRGEESEADQRFVENLCGQLRVELSCESAEVQSFSAQHRMSIETAARRLRYEFFERCMMSRRLDCVATAHTLDDQAETVLMKFTRGAGTRGLAGIFPRLETGHGAIIRPLLEIRRAELESYLKSLEQGWREDSSNRDLHHTRNRVRHCVLPVMETELNPSVRETLAEAAEIAREEERFWEAESAKALHRVTRDGAILAGEFSLLPCALQRRVVLAVAGPHKLQLTFRHVVELCELASNEGAAECSLPEGWIARKQEGRLSFLPPEVSAAGPGDYDYHLAPGEKTAVPETGSIFELELASFGGEYNARDCLPAWLLQVEGMRVRNWRAGDRFQPAHSKRPKKIKELLQEMHISGDDRKLWPVVVAGVQIVWMRGLDSAFSPKPGDRILLIREIRSIEKTGC
jgi:tRNA(Ile)-lysidine synthase